MDGSLWLLANLSEETVRKVPRPEGRVIWREGPAVNEANTLSAWSVLWLHEGSSGGG